jgi:exodeoxyribonuclease-3
MVRILTWNVNGLRSIIKKDIIIDNKPKSTNTLINYFKSADPEIICLSETKLCNDLISDIDSMYPFKYFSHSCITKGYSGVCIYSKIEPMRQIKYDIDDTEGRIICLEFKKYYLVNVYVPNSGQDLKRLGFRMEWDKHFRTFIKKLMNKKNVIITGDMNVAPGEIDIFNPTGHVNNAGFTVDERNSFQELLSLGLVDVWRQLHPSNIEFTYYDYRSKARDRNKGWRIDHFLTTPKLLKKVEQCSIKNYTFGSDHLAIVLDLKD